MKGKTKLLAFAKRNTKEILRDPLTAGFGLGFPVILMLLLSMIQANIPVELFAIKKLAPGMTIFGLCFMTLFSGMLIAKDRETSFLQRLYTTPLTAADFIFGYILPLVPLAAAQSIICYMVAVFLGLSVTVTIVYAVLCIIPISLLFISTGLLCGSIFGEKLVGSVCGALFTNIAAWLSGIWFDLDLVGGLFKKIAYALPFVHAVELERAMINGSYDGIFVHICVIMGYVAVVTTAAVLLFLRQMKRQ